MRQRGGDREEGDVLRQRGGWCFGQMHSVIHDPQTFISNEDIGSELLDTLEDMCPRYYMHSDMLSMLKHQPHNME